MDCDERRSTLLVTEVLGRRPPCRKKPFSNDFVDHEALRKEAPGALRDLSDGHSLGLVESVRPPKACGQTSRLIYLRLEDKFRSHGNGTTGKIANIVVVEIGISGYGESRGLCSDTAYGFRAVVEQIKDLGADLEIESPVGAETGVLQHHQIRSAEAPGPQSVSPRSGACEKSRADETGIWV